MTQLNEVEHRLVDRYPHAAVQSAARRARKAVAWMAFQVGAVGMLAWSVHTGRLQDALDIGGRLTWLVAGGFLYFLVGQITDAFGELRGALVERAIVKRRARAVAALPASRRWVEVPQYQLADAPPAGLAEAQDVVTTGGDQ